MVRPRGRPITMGGSGAAFIDKRKPYSEGISHVEFGSNPDEDRIMTEHVKT